MSANLEKRLAALEAHSGAATGAMVFVGPYREGDDPAPHERVARERWERRMGMPVPSDALIRHIVLVSAKPRLPPVETVAVNNTTDGEA